MAFTTEHAEHQAEHQSDDQPQTNAQPHRDVSLLEDHGMYRAECGYCKRLERSAVNAGMWAHVMYSDVYEAMMVRGWRRSGKWLYKPLNKHTCCPSLPIRLPSSTFEYSREFRRVHAGVVKHLEAKEEEGRTEKDEEGTHRKKLGIAWVRPVADEETYALYRRYQRVVHGEDDDDDDDDDDGDGGDDDDVSGAEQEQGRQQEQGQDQGQEQSLKQEQEQPQQQQKNNKKRKEKEDAVDVANTSYARFLVDSPLVPTKGGTSRVPSPVESANPQKLERPSWLDATFDEPPADAMGSWHIQYRLDGDLVAVSVVDVLPCGVSSVYALYDPDIGRKLQLGKFTSLYELDFSRRRAIALGKENSDYYYLGFYIPSCPKMRYKATYRPSELLCPVTQAWRKIKHDSTPMPHAPADDMTVQDIERILDAPCTHQPKESLEVAQIGPSVLAVSVG